MGVSYVPHMAVGNFTFLIVNSHMECYLRSQIWMYGILVFLYVENRFASLYKTCNIAFGWSLGQRCFLPLSFRVLHM
uniref:Uncharacterized protein n=1 Tax=Anguilla anguilla TaxID=7936 RepID=A0A0E9UYH0_ANGAN